MGQILPFAALRQSVQLPCLGVRRFLLLQGAADNPVSDDYVNEQSGRNKLYDPIVFIELLQ